MQNEELAAKKYVLLNVNWQYHEPLHMGNYIFLLYDCILTGRTACTLISWKQDSVGEQKLIAWKFFSQLGKDVWVLII